MNETIMNARIVFAVIASLFALTLPASTYAGGNRAQLATASLPIAEFGTLESTVLHNSRRTRTVKAHVSLAVPRPRSTSPPTGDLRVSFIAHPQAQFCSELQTYPL
jgi:hypothetical protein